MDWKVLLKNRWLVVLGVLGILLLVVSTVWNGKSANTSALAGQAFATDAGNPQTQTTSVQSTSSTADTNSIVGIEDAYGSKMQAFLSNLMGVKSVSVMVSVNSTNAVALANSVRQSTDTTTTGKETRRSTSTDTQPFTETVGGNTVPFVIQTTSPQVTGVLVLVNAQDFYVAKAEIIDAITNVWDVPAYNISVEPEK